MTNGRRLYLVLALGLAILCLSGCASAGFDWSPLMFSPLLTPTPRPAPTPTTDWSQFVPIWPTATPAPPTPWPTPTPTPLPAFPSEAGLPAGWPPLPDDLFFLRNGGLWLWPRSGGKLEQVVAAPQADDASASGEGPSGGVAAYDLTPDKRYLVYDFWSADAVKPVKLMVLDRKTGNRTVIPTDFLPTVRSDRWFVITPDGHYIIFVAWGAKPKSKPKTERGDDVTTATQASAKAGMIFAAEVQRPRRQYALGYCASYSEAEYEKNCLGLTLAPDGRSVAFADGRGVWVAPLPKGPARLLVKDTFPRKFCGAFDVREWSPDSRRILMRVGCYEGSYDAVLDVAGSSEKGRARWQQIPETHFYVGARVDIAWSQGGQSLLRSKLDLVEGIAHIARVPADDLTQATTLLSSTWPGAFWPISPHDLADGQVGFANQQCIDGPGRPSGIYALTDGDDAPAWMAGLPSLPCFASGHFPQPYALVQWSDDGKAFLYFTRGDDWSLHPALVGAVSGGMIWDVREALAGASGFRWLP